MKDLSSQSQRYLKTYQKLLSFYPKGYYLKYGQPMLQVFADKLRDAEKLKDHHVLRDQFVMAVLELPGSIVGEYLSPHKEKVTEQEKNKNSRRWRWFNIAFFSLLALAFCSAILGNETDTWIPLCIISGIGAVVALAVGAVVSTRRLFVIIPLLAIAGITGLIAQVLVNSLTTGLGKFNAGQNFVNDYFWYGLVQLVALFGVPFLTGYLVVYVFHRFPHRFRRPSLDELTEDQVVVLKTKILRRRRLNLRIGVALVTVFLVANAAGLYDPPTSHADLDLANRVIPEDQNMYSDLQKLQALVTNQEGTGSYQDSLTSIYNGSVWNQEAANKALAGKDDQLNLLAEAAAKPYFQTPTFADMSVYEHSDPNSIPFPQLYGTRVVGKLALVKAASEVQAGNTQAAIQDTLNVIKVGDAILSSHIFFFGYLLGTTVRSDGLDYLQKILASNTVYSTQQKQYILAQLSNLHLTKEPLKNSLKMEYFPQRALLTHLAYSADDFTIGIDVSDGSVTHLNRLTNFLVTLPFDLPYFYQPNRTVAQVSNQYRQVMDVIDRPCGTTKVSEAPNNYDIPFTYRLKTLAFNGIGKQFINFVYLPGKAINDHCAADAQLQKVKDTVRG